MLAVYVSTVFAARFHKIGFTKGIPHEKRKIEKGRRKTHENMENLAIFVSVFFFVLIFDLWQCEIKIY